MYVSISLPNNIHMVLKLFLWGETRCDHYKTEQPYFYLTLTSSKAHQKKPSYFWNPTTKFQGCCFKQWIQKSFTVPFSISFFKKYVKYSNTEIKTYTFPGIVSNLMLFNIPCMTYSYWSASELLLLWKKNNATNLVWKLKRSWLQHGS